MREKRGFFYGVVMAGATAGPVFMASMALAYFYLQIPNPWVLEASDLYGYVALSFPVWIFGFFVAFAVSAMGAAIMLAVSSAVDLADSPLVWGAAGGAMMIAYPAMSGFEGMNPELLFAMVMTGVSCGVLCQRDAE